MCLLLCGLIDILLHTAHSLVCLANCIFSVYNTKTFFSDHLRWINISSYLYRSHCSSEYTWGITSPQGCYCKGYLWCMFSLLDFKKTLLLFCIYTWNAVVHLQWMCHFLYFIGYFVPSNCFCNSVVIFNFSLLILWSPIGQPFLYRSL